MQSHHGYVEVQTLNSNQRLLSIKQQHLTRKHILNPFLLFVFRCVWRVFVQLWNDTANVRVNTLLTYSYACVYYLFNIHFYIYIFVRSYHFIRFWQYVIKKLNQFGGQTNNLRINLYFKFTLLTYLYFVSHIRSTKKYLQAHCNSIEISNSEIFCYPHSIA